jgi:hypothetical protein
MRHPGNGGPLLLFFNAAAPSRISRAVEGSYVMAWRVSVYTGTRKLRRASICTKARTSFQRGGYS